MTLWYYAQERQSYGPFEEEAIKALIREGKISSGCLVWSKGLKVWEPINVHFQTDFVSQSQEDSCVEGNPVEALRVETKNYWLSAIKVYAINIYASKYFIPLTLFLASFLPVSFLLRDDGFFERENHKIFLWIFFSLPFFSACYALFVLRKFVIQKGSRNIDAGLPKLATVAVVFLVVAYAIYIPQSISFINKVDTARQAFDRYTLDYKPELGAIFMDGLIGPSLTKDISKKLDIHSGINLIQINSAGGLIDQGLSVARVIESYKTINTRAHKQCNSSCLIVFMSGSKRYADWNMSFGFHASDVITKMDPDFVQKPSIEADVYLMKRGIPMPISRAFIVETDNFFCELLRLVRKSLASLLVIDLTARSPINSIKSSLVRVL